jgi:hypothetical protein
MAPPMAKPLSAEYKFGHFQHMFRGPKTGEIQQLFNNFPGK